MKAGHGPRDLGALLRCEDSNASPLPYASGLTLDHFDAVAHRYAIEVAGGVDGLALTHLDTADAEPELRLCRSYTLDGDRLNRLEAGPFRDLGHQSALTAALLRARPVLDDAAPGDWVEAIGDAVGARVRLTSRGPTSAGKAVRA